MGRGRTVLYVGLGVAACAAAAFAVVGRERIWRLAAGPADLGAVDFASLEPAPHVNGYVVCPDEFCPPRAADETAPVFDVSADRLFTIVEGVAAREPRTERVDPGGDPLRARYVVRSHLMRFPDTVSVEVVPLGPDRSSVAIFSRANLPGYDWGVNRARVERWLSEIETAAAG
ncbi:DUF1499 domain-containing protein [Amorphus orientalis]|uniref:Uncharacterized protein (DUF1499 family) n=1 Tax=Amorphus orientalis TaxID=649198 RepID=A0AAE4ATT8_9HYPH|nr:DUF1499 domain-containing protein [Amorphus orientalis]MDQ0316678.1 uncharacterized protein (DUF1499 family) [Amorphus orientalis]